MDYTGEVEHSDQLIIRGAQPFNAEPLASALVEFVYTPEELIYCRNHSPVKEYDEDNYIVKIDGLVKEPLEFKLTDLRDSFPHVEVVAALQCAGNRRKEMAMIKEVKGITWDNGVIANCRWKGLRLRDILIRAGVDETQAKHIWFASNVSICQDDTYYGGSIPISKAMDPEGDVLLALEMNGQTLSPDHGYPLRIVVPGYTGARWVKWVDRITVAGSESPNFYQQRDYRILPSEVETVTQAEAYWDKVQSIGSLAVNSIIASIKPAPIEGSDMVLVKGYAMGRGGEDGRVVGVQVSLEGSDKWLDARITYQEGKWSWTLWECVVNLAVKTQVAKERDIRKEQKILCRARDAKGEVQKSECPWNFRGVAYNAYGMGVWRL